MASRRADCIDGFLVQLAPLPHVSRRKSASALPGFTGRSLLPVSTYASSPQPPPLGLQIAVTRSGSTFGRNAPTARERREPGGSHQTELSRGAAPARVVSLPPGPRVLQAPSGSRVLQFPPGLRVRQFPFLPRLSFSPGFCGMGLTPPLPIPQLVLHSPPLRAYYILLEGSPLGVSSSPPLVLHSPPLRRTSPS